MEASIVTQETTAKALWEADSCTVLNNNNMEGNDLTCLRKYLD